jgi:hypothetical protein
VPEVTELNRHDPDVPSVVSRLSRHVGRIKHITAIVEWDDGSCDIYGDTKSLGSISWHHTLLTKKLLEEV